MIDAAKAFQDEGRVIGHIEPRLAQIFGPLLSVIEDGLAGVFRRPLFYRHALS